jgi:secreted PhoX family phosphatase
MAPDGRSLFVNIQHPGGPASERSDPVAPRAISNWPISGAMDVPALQHW